MESSSEGSLSPSSSSSSSSSGASSDARSGSEKYELCEDGKIIITPDRDVWEYVGPLKGRGQRSLAGFFKDINGHVYLVKQDKPGVCLAEGTVVDRSLPAAYRQCVNCAKLGCLSMPNGKDCLISIQDQVTANEAQQVRSLDEVVYGRKRNPSPLSFKTMSYESDESRYSDVIISFLQDPSRLSPEAKRQLAYAVQHKISVGDESVHLGQFMAIVEDECVVGVRAIDYGARDRLALARHEYQHYDPVKTSMQYQNQYWIGNPKGKNYIEFLLKDEEFERFYLEAWLDMDPDLAAYHAAHNLRDELKRIPNEQLKEKALNEFVENVNQGAQRPIIIPKDENFSLSEKIDYFILKYFRIIQLRNQSMKIAANTRLSELKKMLFIDYKQHLNETIHATSDKIFPEQGHLEDSLEIEPEERRDTMPKNPG